MCWELLSGAVAKMTISQATNYPATESGDDTNRERFIAAREVLCEWIENGPFEREAYSIVELCNVAEESAVLNLKMTRHNVHNLARDFGAFHLFDLDSNFESLANYEEAILELGLVRMAVRAIKRSGYLYSSM